MINKALLEFLLLIISIVSAFYKLIKIEGKINESINCVRNSLMIHEKAHDLINYQIEKIQTDLEDHNQVLRSNDLLRRRTD